MGHRMGAGRRTVAAATSIVAIGLAVAAAQPAAAVPDPRLTVQAVTLSRASVLVSGVNVVRVGVQVRATYADPAAPADLPLTAFLSRTATGGPIAELRSRDLTLVSGTPEDGVWAGDLWVPSTANGAFKVTGVRPWPDTPESPSTIDPTTVDGPSLSVTGVHQPGITATTSPNPVPVGSAFSVVGRVVDTATGLPYTSSVAVRVGFDNLCVEGEAPTVRTSSAGTFGLRMAAGASSWLLCADIRTQGTYVAGVSMFARRPGDLTARPAAAFGSVGTSVTVLGNARSALGCPVVLQKLRGATQWRGQTLARVRTSGRFTLLAPLTTAGTGVYRVYLPPCQRMLDATTPRFSIVAR